MMVFTTTFLAVAILALLYFVAIRWIVSSAVAYGLIGVVGLLCLLFGSVHFVYVGVEILAFGTFLVWAHHRWWSKRRNPAPSSPDA